MGVVGVEKCAATELSQNGGNDPGIETCSPGRSGDGDTGNRQAAGQLTPGAGNDDLIQSPLLELAGKQPDLALPAAPLSA
jgi:hypothetical protein